jgi:hypothetical protein
VEDLIGRLVAREPELALELHGALTGRLRRDEIRRLADPRLGFASTPFISSASRSVLFTVSSSGKIAARSSSRRTKCSLRKNRSSTTARPAAPKRFA